MPRRSVIKLKLVRSIGSPDKRFWRDLQDISRDCDRMRNGLVDWWRSWRRDHPEYQAEAKVAKDGVMHRRGNGEPYRFNAPGPIGEKSPTTILYHAAAAIAPRVSSRLVTAVSNEIYAKLKANVPYGHRQRGGCAQYVWEAILWHEVASPSFTTRIIPVPNNTAVLSWDSCLALKFPLFSRGASGRKVLCPSVELACDKLGHGYKMQLRNAIAGEYKFSDSTLVFRKNKWYLHAVITMPEVVQRDSQKMAVLRAGGVDAKWPFFVDVPGGREGIGVGYGIPLRAEHERIYKRRQAIKNRSRLGISAGRGHGKHQFFETLRKDTRRINNVSGHFRRSLVHQVIRICDEHQVGVLRYEQPSMYAREKETWFAGNRLQYNWTDTLALLTHGCLKAGIKLDVPKAEKAAKKKAKKKTA